MQDLRETIELMQSMTLQLRIAKVKMELSRTLILQNSFDEVMWQQQNWGDFNRLEWHLNQYEARENSRAEIVIPNKDRCVYWRFLIELYLEKELNWIKENINFLEIQLGFFDEMIRLCDNETLRLQSIM